MGMDKPACTYLPKGKPLSSHMILRSHMIGWKYQFHPDTLLQGRGA